MNFLLEMILPFIFKFLDLWLQKNAKNKAMVDSYYNFLQQIDSAGAANVRQYLASEDALKTKQEELKKELEAPAPEPERNPAISPAMKRNFLKRP